MTEVTGVVRAPALPNGKQQARRYSARVSFSRKSRQNKEPTSGLEPLTCSLRVIGHALQTAARTCKSRISKGVSLLRVALYCIVLRSRWCQSGVKYHPCICLRPRAPPSQFYDLLARQTTTPAPYPPQPLAAPPDALPASCTGSGKTPGNRSSLCRVPISECRGCPVCHPTSARPSSDD
jgi:hypothetical protein